MPAAALEVYPVACGAGRGPAARTLIVRGRRAPRAFPGALGFGIPIHVDPRRLPVFDAHVDSIGRALDLGHDLGRRGPGHLDLVRAREGGLGALVLVCWVDPERFPDASFPRAAALLERIHDLARRHPDLAVLVGNGADLERARAAGRTAAIAGIEGGHAIEESLEKLRWFFERGVRVLTLVWNNHLRWVRSCQPGAGADVPAGLSAFGREVVAEMNRLGMLIDVSHACPRTLQDVLEASARPVIASHSGCAALHEHPRNVRDEDLRRLASAGGVLGIVFHPGFLDAAARAEEARVRDTRCYRDVQAASPAAAFLKRQRILRAKAAPLPLERLVDHVAHAAEVAGVEHVGLGSDFDGIERGPAGLEDARCYPALAEALARRGFAPAEVEAVLGANLRRVFAQVTGPGTAAHRAAITPLVAALT